MSEPVDGEGMPTEADWLEGRYRDARDQIRPVPFDPTAYEVGEMFDLRSEEWLVGEEGDYITAVVEAMKQDGSGWGRRVAIEYPVRVNSSTEQRTLRLMLDADDAENLAAAITASVKWLRAAERMGN